MENQEPRLVLGALLVDLENLYLAYKDDYHNPAEATITTLQAVQKHLVNMGISPVVGRAYAPFDYAAARSTISDLSLMGITPIHVVSYPTKNSADLMLAIDAMEILFRRNDIGAFVIVGGDRDYIPVVDRIRQHAKRVIVVSPRKAMSGDLLTIVGEPNYIDPLPLLPDGRLRPLVPDPKTPDSVAPPAQAQVAPAASAPAPAEQATPSVHMETPPATAPTKGLTPFSISESKYEPEPIPVATEEDLKTLMGLILSFMSERKVREVWLSPFFRVLNDAFPLKSNAERKDLVHQLVEMGAVKIEDRPRIDDVGTYAVLTVNWSHPLVIEVNPG